MQSFVVEIGAEIRCGQQKAEPSYPPENVCCLRLAIVRVSLWELIDVSLSGCLATEMTNVIFMKVSTSVSQATGIRSMKTGIAKSVWTRSTLKFVTQQL